MTESDTALWQNCLARLKQEMAELPPAERAWISARLLRIGALQEQMHAFFLRAEGAQLCGHCRGGCCERGKYHLTLVNLLPYLLQGTEPPVPDFNQTCPFLGSDGCRLPIAGRPFNCVNFLCEQVEARLSEKERAALQLLERQLRELYLEFDRRYAGSSLRGLLIRAGRLGERPFLDRL